MEFKYNELTMQNIMDNQQYIFECDGDTKIIKMKKPHGFCMECSETIEEQTEICPKCHCGDIDWTIND